MLRPRRRVRLRQVDRRAGDRALPPVQRHRHGRRCLGRRHRRARAQRGGAARLPSRHVLDGLPEPRHGPQPDAAREPAAHGGLRAARRIALPGDGACDRRADGGQDRGSRLGHEALSPPALGRHAAARRDRDGACHRSQAARARRADDGPRRDRRGRGARPHLRAPDTAQHGGAVHQPQPRRDREDVPPRRRALRGAARRGGHGRRRPADAAPSVHRGPAALHPAEGRAASRTAGSTRSRASCPRSAPTCPGCVFVHRCALAEDICREQRPEPFQVGEQHTSRCFFHEKAASLPRDTAERGALPVVDRAAEPLLRIEDLAKTFRQDGRDIYALAGVSATLQAGETLGLVGESGSGKTTFARALLGIIEPTRGSVAVDGRELPTKLAGRTSSDVASMQIVFQNPDSALNRRHRVSRLLAALAEEAARPHRRQGRAACARADRRRPPAAALARRPADAALRRAEAARGDRARVLGRAQARRLRRADLRARRLRAGRHPQSARRSPGRAPDELRLHQPRPRRRPLPVGPDRGALPRPPDGARHGAGGVRRPAPSVHRGAALRRALHRPGADAHQALRRHPVGRESALRLRLPDALSAQARSDLRGRRAAARGRRRRPADELPHPARGAPPHPGRRRRVPRSEAPAAGRGLHARRDLRCDAAPGRARLDADPGCLHGAELLRSRAGAGVRATPGFRCASPTRCASRATSSSSRSPAAR